MTAAMAGVTAVTRRLLQRVKGMGIRYWLTACIIFVGAYEGSPFVYEKLDFSKTQAHYFQFLLDHGPRSPMPQFVRVVLIGDDEYWSDELAGRRPLKRTYLANLITHLVSANAQVIALDFDVRLQDPKSKAIPEEYFDETCALIGAIKDAAHKGKKVVLATPIADNPQGGYRREPDIYQVNGLCKPRDSVTLGERVCGIDFDAAEKRNITCGYIALPFDILAIPIPLHMEDDSYLDSFALAVARAKEPEVTKHVLEHLGGELPYGNFMPLEKFTEYKAELSAGQVVRDEIDPDQVDAKAVIVGGNWHSLAANRGPRIDIHATAAGPMVGTLLHANYVEALLDRRTFAVVPEWFLTASEITFGIFAATVFAAYSRFWGLGAFVPLIILMLGAQWAMLHGFGFYFDVLVPLVGLGLHSFGERLIGHHAAKQTKRKTLTY
jgi:hypothetical protein